MEDLSLDRIAALVPEFVVKDLPLGRTLMMMMMINIINIKKMQSIINTTKYIYLNSYDIRCPGVAGRIPAFQHGGPGSIPDGGQEFCFLGLGVCPLPAFCPVLSLTESLTLC